MTNMPKTRYRSSFETDRRIIMTLALEKEFAQYDLDERIGKDYRTVLRRLQFLERTGLIAVVRTEDSKKKGINRKILTLTENGLLYALANPKEWDRPEEQGLWPDIDKVAQNYRDLLPLIFGEWQFYIDNGLHDEIISRLQAAVLGLSKEFGADWYRIVMADRSKALKVYLQKMKDKEKARQIWGRFRRAAPTLTNRVLGLDSFLFLGEGANAESTEWTFISKLIQNIRLQKYLDNEFQFWTDEAEKEHEKAKSILVWYQKLKKQNDVTN